MIDDANAVPPSVRRAVSAATDPIAAAAELHRALNGFELSLVLFFCSAEYAQRAFAFELTRLFDGVLVVGCTGAGEIGPGGYQENSVTAVSFARPDFEAVAALLVEGGGIDLGRCGETDRPAAARTRPPAGGQARRCQPVRLAVHRQHDATRGRGGLAGRQRARGSSRARRLGWRRARFRAHERLFRRLLPPGRRGPAAGRDQPTGADFPQPALRRLRPEMVVTGAEPGAPPRDRARCRARSRGLCAAGRLPGGRADAHGVRHPSARGPAGRRRVCALDPEGQPRRQPQLLLRDRRGPGAHAVRRPRPAEPDRGPVLGPAAPGSARRRW